MIFKRLLFGIYWQKLVEADDVLVNIDESSISRNTHPNKSWSFIGSIPEIRGGSFRNTVSLIAAISSEGWHFAHATTQTTNGERFSQFWADLLKFRRQIKNGRQKRWIALLDNARYHHTRESRRALELTFDAVVYLPPYSPSYAPIELWFSIFKRTLIRLSKGRSWNLTSEGGKQAIKLASESISMDKIVNLWRHWQEEVSNDITELVECLRNFISQPLIN